MSAAASYQRVVICGDTEDGQKSEVGITSNGLDVNIQDQTTPPFALYFVEEDGTPTTLTAQGSIDDTEIDVASVADISIGTYIGIFSGVSGESRYFFGNVTNIVGTTVSIDTPLDFAFDIGDAVVPLNRDMNVDGSLSTRVFDVRAGGPTTDLIIDITRVILVINSTDPMNYPDFGDIAGGLVNGIVLRRVDGDTRNIWNIKTNSDMAQVAYDVNIRDQVRPGDSNALSMRQSFAGQSKHGVAIRLFPGDALELLVQDDLSSLLKFRLIAQGHITTGENVPN